MGNRHETAALDQAKRLAVGFVSPQSNRADILMGFWGRLGPSTVNSILTFQGSLRHELGISLKIAYFREGCVEVGFVSENKSEVLKLFELIEARRFDVLAYTYKVLFVRSLSVVGLDEYHFERDSLYR